MMPTRRDNISHEEDTLMYFNPVTGEVTRWPYRFKTRKELKEEFGDRWRYVIDAGWTSSMDTYLGQDVKSEDADTLWNDRIQLRRFYDPFPVIKYEGWDISKSMIVPNDSLSSTYNQRSKLIYESGRDSIQEGRYFNPITFEETPWKYRFKTEKEFEDEFGPGWKSLRHLGASWVHSMDGYLGMDIDDEETEHDFDLDKFSNYHGWNVTKYMITNNENARRINYRRRKIVYENSNINERRILTFSIYENKGKEPYINPVTGERTKWPYRFKTKDEFIEEFGYNWRSSVPSHWVIEMDPLLGEDVKSDVPQSVWERNGTFTYDDDDSQGSWVISKKMMTPNNSLPSYGRRKLVYEDAQSRNLQKELTDGMEKAPRYINDISGSPTAWKYRFKTKEEFEKEFGEEWRTKVGPYWLYIMDSMLGTDVSDKIAERDMDLGWMYTYYKTYYIGPNMITNNMPISEIDYNRRGELMYESTNEEHSYFNRVTGRQTKWPCRFKTEDEFKNEFGNEWMDAIKNRWNTDMNSLLGQDVESKYAIDLCTKDGRSTRHMMYAGWFVGRDMLTKNDPAITYNRRQTVYESGGRGMYIDEVTGEATYWPYRFKTEDEFKEEFGEGWKNDSNVMWNEDMMPYLGKDFMHKEAEELKSGRKIRIYYDPLGTGPQFFVRGGWSIRDWMITKNPVRIAYNDRHELVYESTEEPIYINEVTGKPTKWPYRFKTKEELDDDIESGRAQNVAWNPAMNSYYGQDFIHPDADKLEDPREYVYYDPLDTSNNPYSMNIHRRGGWAIRGKMLKKNRTIDYSAREIVYEGSSSEKEKLPKPSKIAKKIEVDGFTVLIGRNAYMNDILTTKVADPDDYWLHTKGSPGAHILIKTNGQSVDDSTIRKVAKIAAEHSMAKEGKVDVVVTKAKNVTKHSGQKPGEVSVDYDKSLIVTTKKEKK